MTKLIRNLMFITCAHCVLAQSVITIPSTVKYTGFPGFGMNMGPNATYAPFFLQSDMIAPTGLNMMPMQLSSTIYAAATGTFTDSQHVTIKDQNTSSSQPANVWANWSGSTSQFYYVSGTNVGVTGYVSASTAATGSAGQVLSLVATSGTFSAAPAINDMVAVVQPVVNPALSSPEAQFGSAILPTGSYTYAWSSDVPPSNISANRIQSLSVPYGGHVYAYLVQNSSFSSNPIPLLNGTYSLNLAAKAATSGAGLSCGVVDTNLGTIISQTVPITYNATSGSGWQAFSYPFTVSETTPSTLIVVNCTPTSGTVLIAYMQLVETQPSSNPTSYRNAVYTKVSSWKPGSLRYMAQNTWGCMPEEIMQPSTGRSACIQGSSNITFPGAPQGLNDFLVLAKSVGAIPVISLSFATMPSSMAHLMSFLGSPCSTDTYSQLRCSQSATTATWTSQFSQIILEFGNEEWNSANSTAGYIFNYNGTFGIGYGPGILNARNIVAAKAATGYSSVIKFMGNGFHLGTSSGNWNNNMLAGAASVSGGQMDYIDVDNYQISALTSLTPFQLIAQQAVNDDSLTSGTLYGTTTLATSDGVKTAIYEANLGTTCFLSSYTQSNLDQSIGSVGSASAMILGDALSVRDNPVPIYNNFVLTGQSQQFSIASLSNSCGQTGSPLAVPIWGMNLFMPAGAASTGVINQDLTSGIAFQTLENAFYGKSNILNSTRSGTTINASAGLPNTGGTSGYQVAANAALPQLEELAATDGSGNYALAIWNLDPSAAHTATLAGAASPVTVGATSVTQSIFGASNALTDSNDEVAFGGTPVVSVPTPNSAAPSTTYSVPAGTFIVLTYSTGTPISGPSSISGNIKMGGNIQIQ